MSNSFRDLEIWQISVQLTSLIYRLTATFPNYELYGLAAQMRRASVSISSNIAEGVGRGTRRDYRHFVILARGSTCELHTQLLVAADLGYATQDDLRHAEQRISQIGRMLNGLAKYLRQAGRTKSSANIT